VSRTTEKRLAAIERRLQMSKPVLHEVHMFGGLVRGIYPQASLGRAQAIEPEPGEDLPQFPQRVRSMAQRLGGKFIVYGGLPEGPVEWATPPGMEEALTKSFIFGRDEIDN